MYILDEITSFEILSKQTFFNIYLFISFHMKQDSKLNI